jgi:N-carbamoyl-L-amino-acid hydrolase
MNTDHRNFPQTIDGTCDNGFPSTAVQDSQQIAKIAPMGMIFVPSRDGISHSPKEFSSWQEIENGTEVLYRVVLLLDDRLNRN